LPDIPQLVQTLKIAELGRLAGRVPALHDALELRHLAGCVMPEPAGLDEAAAQWRRHLLVLARKIVFADRSADLLEHRERLARRVQGLAAPALKATPPQRAVDEDRLVLLGDRRQTDDLPVLLRQHVANQIVLVQPVHDQHDRTLLLVVQPAVEHVVEPFVGALPVRFRQGLFGLQRVVDDDVGTPPGQDAADRSGDPTALRRRLKFGHGLMRQI